MSSKSLKISVIGLPQAGKTSLVHRLKHNTFLQRPKTTIGVIPEVVDTEGVRLVLWDIGGQFFHVFWERYRKGTKGLMYVIDAVDQTRFYQSLEILRRIRREKEIENIPIVIVVNKNDITAPSGKAELVQALKQHEREGKIKIFETSAKTGEGIREAMNWLKERITMQEKVIKI